MPNLAHTYVQRRLWNLAAESSYDRNLESEALTELFVICPIGGATG